MSRVQLVWFPVCDMWSSFFFCLSLADRLRVHLVWPPAVYGSSFSYLPICQLMYHAFSLCGSLYVALWSSYFYYNAEVVHNGDKIKMRDAVGNFLKSPAVQVCYTFMHFSFTKRCLSVSISVADPGSSAFLTPGSEIRNSFFFRFPDLGSRIPNRYF